MKRLSASDFLRYSSGVAMVICSIALLVFSLTSATARSAPAQPDSSFKAVGAVVKDGVVQVVGFIPGKDGGQGVARALAHY